MKWYEGATPLLSAIKKQIDNNKRIVYSYNNKRTVMSDFTRYSGFYKPRSKKDLLAVLLPDWQGSKTDLRQMSTKRLSAIYNSMMTKKYIQAMRRDNESK